MKNTTIAILAAAAALAGVSAAFLWRGGLPAPEGGAAYAPQPGGQTPAGGGKPDGGLLKRGDRGPAVLGLQKALGFSGAAADGVFGPETEAALMKKTGAKTIKPGAWASWPAPGFSARAAAQGIRGALLGGDLAALLEAILGIGTPARYRETNAVFLSENAPGSIFKKTIVNSVFSYYMDIPKHRGAREKIKEAFRQIGLVENGGIWELSGARGAAFLGY